MSQHLIETGIDIIGAVPWGTHFCQFYQTKEDLLDILVPYFKAGLENNEFCMWVTAEPLSAEEAFQAMVQSMPDFADRLHKGQIQILPHTDWYLRGGKFDQQRVLDGWAEKLDAALAAGYAGLRLTGNTFWLEKQDWRSFTDYEAAVNEVIGKHHMLALCTYSLDKCGAAEVMDVIRNHEFALIREEGQWELIENAIHRQAKQALIDSESKYRELVESLQEGVWVIDREAKTTFVNPRMAQMLGYRVEEMLGRDLFSFVDEHYLSLAREGFDRRRRGVREEVECEFRRKDGTRLRALVSTAPLTDPTGTFSGAIAGITDITERKRMEDELRAGEERYRGLYGSVAGGIVVQDKNGIIVEASAAAREILGLEIDEITGRTSANPEWQAVHEDGSPFPGEDHPAMVTLRTGEPVRGVVMGVFNPNSGQHRWILINSEPVRHEKTGQVEMVTTTFLDITKRRQVEEALRDSEARYRGIVETAQEGIVIGSPDGRFIFVNQRMADMLGYAKEEMLGKTGLDFMHEEQRELVVTSRRQLEEGQVVNAEYKFRRKDGSTLWTLCSATPMYDGTGRHVGNLALHNDITERRVREAKILKLTQLYAVLSRANEAIVRIGEVKSLYSEICRIVAEESGFPLVWIGQVEGQNVVPWAWSGPATDYLKGIKVKVQGDLGVGPTGTCIRENRVVVNNDFETNTTMSPWRKAASDYGFRASAAFPLYREGRAVGALSLYSFEPHAFDADQIRLLESLSSDISYALDSIDREERRIQAEQQLGFQVDILSHIFDAVVVVDNEGAVTYWNEIAEQIYDVPAVQAIGHKLEDLREQVWLTPEDEQDSKHNLAKSGHWTGENFHVKKNGERVYARSSVSMMRDENGEKTGMVAVIRDRTKWWQAQQEVKLLNDRLRQQAEDRYRSTDASFRTAISSSADGIVVVRKDGVIRFANPAAASLLGREPTELVGTLFRFPLVEGTEIEIPKDNGEKAFAEMRIVELDWEGAPAYLATLRDVTRRKQGLLALQESETRLRLLLDQIPCVSWTLDTKLRFTSFTGSATEAYKATPDQMLGLSLADYFKEEKVDFVPYVVHRQALQGTPATYELSLGGRTFYSRVEPLRDADDRIVGVVGVAFDITDRKLTEEQLRNLSHRLVSAQENERRKIARELHDEVGQSLTALKLCLDKISLSSSSGDGSELGEARKALRELMAQVRSMSLELRPTMLDDLGLLPTLLWHFKRYTAQTNVQVNFKHRGLRRDLPQDTVTAAYRIVQEALTNVARYAKVQEVLVVVRAEYDALLVEVEDQGVGFDVDNVAYASTGLSGMRERALSLNGKLLVQSKPGEGTCVIAELPLAKRSPKRRRSKENDKRSSG